MYQYIIVYSTQSSHGEASIRLKLTRERKALPHCTKKRLGCLLQNMLDVKMVYTTDYYLASGSNPGTQKFANASRHTCSNMMMGSRTGWSGYH